MTDVTLDGDPGQDAGSRSATLAANLATVDARIDAACAAAGRDRSDVVLVAVTKTFPASDVRILADLGVIDVAESRDQEAAEKVAACADLPLRWHFVGRVQTNKARSVSSYADVVHSVDRHRLVAALVTGATAAERDLDVFVQVSLDGDPTRGGVVEADLARLADAVTHAPRLQLLGLMAIAPLDTDPRRAFDRLAELADRTRVDHPQARWLSAGMSNDLEAAIAAGATHVRVGTGILGSRPVLG
jgi:PLP dependent protein